jgi:hypothetical protein
VTREPARAAVSVYNSGAVTPVRAGMTAEQ